MEQDKSLRERMVEYERNLQLNPTMPIVVRLDGIGFSKHDFGKPFDPYFNQTMKAVAAHLTKVAQGINFIYTQSDELNLFFLPREFKQYWYGGKPFKLVAVSAVEASMVFTETYNKLRHEVDANYISQPYKFDSRVFNVPADDLPNYLIYRSRDAYRNSVCQIARQYFSHQQLFKKNTDQAIQMLSEQNIHLRQFNVFNLMGGIQLPKHQMFASYAHRTYSDWKNLIEIWYHLEKREGKTNNEQ